MTFCYSLSSVKGPIMAGIPAPCSLWMVESVSSSNVTIMSDHRGNKSYEPHRVGLDLQLDLCSDSHFQPEAPGETSTFPQGDWPHSQLSSAEGPQS